MRKIILYVLVSLIPCVLFAQDEEWNPRRNWLDSYEANGFCWCETTFDHGIGEITVEINGMDVAIRDICAELENHPDYKAYEIGDPPYNDIQCGNGPPNNHDILDEQGCPGRTDLGSEGCDIIGPNWDMEWLATRFGVEGFIPDPNKTYYIDVPFHNLRLAADGISEEPYTTDTDTTGDDVEWQFVDNGNGYWHIQRAAGGTNPRLRSDNSSSADMQPTAWSGVYTYYSFTTGAIGNSYFLTLPDGPISYKRLQVDRSGNVNMVAESSNGTWESFTITEVEDLSNTSGTIVHITKSNATGFALDGDGGAENGQNIYLWSENENNVNQQWIEIDRGNGYYSYQKQGTEYCIDGNGGGTNNQNVYLWQCAENNQNQHWQKVAMADGSFTLIKRNATGFALNSDDGGANGQNVDLYEVSTTGQNQQWYITAIGTAAKSVTEEVLANEVSIYPNPITSETTIQGASNSIISVYNISGQELLTKEILSDKETLDFSSLSIGVYYVQVKGVQSILVIKVVKE